MDMRRGFSHILWHSGPTAPAGCGASKCSRLRECPGSGQLEASSFALYVSVVGGFNLDGGDYKSLCSRIRGLSPCSLSISSSPVQPLT